MQTIVYWLYLLGQQVLARWVRVSVTGNPPANEELLCYVMESPSITDAMVLATYCEAEKLPAAIARQHSPRATNIVHLPRRRRDDRYPDAVTTPALPVEGDLVLQPVSVYWGRAPKRQSSLWKLLFADTWSVASRLRKLLTILFNGRETRLHFGQPVSLAELLKKHAGDPLAAQRALEKAFRDYRAGIIGPDLSHRRTVVRDLLLSEAVKAAIQAEAADGGIESAQKKAAQYANEIAADFSYAATRAVFLILEWLWNRLYKGVSVYHSEQLTELASRYSLVYVPCHRSHIDSFLLAYCLDVKQMPTPHFAAGINMNMPLIGPLFRRLGAFFLRRSFKDNALYKAVFNEYLHSMFSRGFPIAYFVEGGRSRSGRTLPPKAGMLSMTVRSYLRKPTRPIAFVPVYAGYEKIIEERSYLGELRGKQKKGESLLGALAATRYLFSQFGRVYLNFGQPIILDEVLDAANPQWRKAELTEQAEKDWVRPAVNQLTSLVGQRINEAVVANGVNLTALALLSTPRQAMDETRLQEQLLLYYKLLTALPYSESVVLAEASPQTMIASVEALGLIDRIPNALGDILRLEGNEAVLMSYYRNNVLHLLALPALIAALFRLNERLRPDAIINACQGLYPYLKAELLLRWDEARIAEPVQQWLNALQAEGLLNYHDGYWNRPTTGTHPAQQLNIMGESIRPTMERFEIVMTVLEHTGGKSDRAQLAHRCQLVGQRLAALHGFNAPEFFEPLLFKRFIEVLVETGVLESKAGGIVNLTETGRAVSQRAGLILDDSILGNIGLLSAESAQRVEKH